MMRIPIAKEGIHVLALGGVMLFGAAGLVGWLSGGAGWAWLSAATAAVAWAALACFFRDPERHTPAEAGLFVSPADGVITDVTPIGPESSLQAEGIRIGVFMNVANVHVNRAPCNGRVLSVDHSPGLKIDVRRQDAWARNESVTMKVACTEGGRNSTVAVRQVAGFVARRIINRHQPGDELARGQRIGMILFGSRLELMLPSELDASVVVEPGRKVRAGETVLARCAASSRIENAPAGATKPHGD